MIVTEILPGCKRRQKPDNMGCGDFAVKMWSRLLSMASMFSVRYVRLPREKVFK